jgi:hypothetical protein
MLTPIWYNWDMLNTPLRWFFGKCHSKTAAAACWLYHHEIRSPETEMRWLVQGTQWLALFFYWSRPFCLIKLTAEAHEKHKKTLFPPGYTGIAHPDFLG